MLRPESPSASLAQPFEPARVAGVAPADDASRFSPSFASLRAEIVDFIQHGAATAVTASPSGPWSADAALASLASPTSPAAVQALMRNPAAARDDDPAGQRAGFLASIAPLARQAGAALGVAPDILAAQAALETGWGRRSLRDANGADLHNLFGIKAGANWPGASSEATTTEFIGGEAIPQRERFRRYDDAASAFDDLTRLLKTDPRYQSALNAGPDVQAYGEALARGGYATDPDYAAKLAAVVARLRAERPDVSR